MLFTITTTRSPATDLGWLLTQNTPRKYESFDLTFGQAMSSLPEVGDERCTAALVLDVDPVGLTRSRHNTGNEIMRTSTWLRASFHAGNRGAITRSIAYGAPSEGCGRTGTRGSPLPSVIAARALRSPSCGLWGVAAKRFPVKVLNSSLQRCSGVTRHRFIHFWIANLLLRWPKFQARGFRSVRDYAVLPQRNAIRHAMIWKKLVSQPLSKWRSCFCQYEEAIALHPEKEQQCVVIPEANGAKLKRAKAYTEKLMTVK